MFKSNSLRIERVAIDAIRSPEHAVVRHTRKQIRKAGAVLTAYGQILATSDGEIIYWEEVWLALKETGATEANVVFVQNQSKEEVAAIRLALQRIPREAKWDREKVQIVLGHLADAKVDVEITGFDEPEIANFLDPTFRTNGYFNETIPKHEEPTVSRPGYIWRLGRHRIGCGAADDHALLKSIFEESRATSVFLDSASLWSDITTPPYEAELEDTREAVTEPASPKHFESLRATLSVVQRFCESHAPILVATEAKHLLKTTAAADAAGVPLQQIITVIRSIADPTDFYREQSDFICLLGAARLQRPTKRSNVWRYTDSYSKKKALAEARQAVSKTILIAEALHEISEAGDIVLDTCIGIGSTLIAAEQALRTCHGIETDPARLDVALRRWETLTNQDAILQGTGQTFKSVREQRLAQLSEPAGAR